MTESADMNLLAIDTSSSALRLAVRFGADRLVQSNDQVDRAHGQMIMRKISNLFESSGIEVGQIGGLVVCLGPGSFTGLRVGIAVAKGIAVAQNIPIVGVSLFDIAATKLGAMAKRSMAIIPHRRGEYYAALMGRPVTDENVRIVTQSMLASLAVEYRLVGLGLDTAALSHDEHRSIDNLDYSAADLLYLGAERIAAGRIDQVETLEPLYFGKSQAEIKFDQRRQQQ